MTITQPVSHILGMFNTHTTSDSKWRCAWFIHCKECRKTILTANWIRAFRRALLVFNSLYLCYNSISWMLDYKIACEVNMKYWNYSRILDHKHLRSIVYLNHMYIYKIIWLYVCVHSKKGECNPNYILCGCSGRP